MLHVYRPFNEILIPKCEIRVRSRTLGVMTISRIGLPLAIGLVCTTSAAVAIPRAARSPQPGGALEATAALGPVEPGGLRAVDLDDPDRLYRDRQDLSKAARAADMWAARADIDFDAAWKLSRVCYWLGAHVPQSQRRAALERGINAGETAVRMASGRSEGHFWTAANMGALAEFFGLVQGLKYRGKIKSHLEQANAIAPGWQGGSVEAALGQWYFEVPRLFGGSRAKAEEHLRRALQYNPDSRVALSFLAEVLAADGRLDEARALLRRVIDAPTDCEWIPEDREFTKKAAERLVSLGK